MVADLPYFMLKNGVRGALSRAFSRAQLALQKRNVPISRAFSRALLTL